ncbi:MAG: iron-sulfur cluster assembly scaffold protein [Gammaproteobacteria bacterium]|nr:iron-sulfur cluster assembly scaffold protein [Gammaproteobacteria bacterium]
MDYSPLVLEHFDHPRNVGPLPPGEGAILRGAAGAADQGQVICFEIRTESGRIEAAAFQALACPEVIAACSLVTEHLQGQALETLGGVTAASLAERLGASPAKLAQLLLVEDALRNCWRAWENNELCVSPPGRSETWQ